MPVLYTGELTMYASSFAAGLREQWLDRIVVNGVDGEPLFAVSIKKDIQTGVQLNRSKASPSAFETIDVTIGKATSPLTSMPPPNGFFRSHWGVHFGIAKMDQLFEFGPSLLRTLGTTIGRARREAVQIRCKAAHLFIVSSPAREYFAHQDLAVKYAHLDLIVHEMRDRAGLRGLLPELWGLRRLSNATKALMGPPQRGGADPDGGALLV